MQNARMGKQGQSASAYLVLAIFFCSRMLAKSRARLHGPCWSACAAAEALPVAGRARGTRSSAATWTRRGQAARTSLTAPRTWAGRCAALLCSRMAPAEVCVHMLWCFNDCMTSDPLAVCGFTVSCAGAGALLPGAQLLAGGAGRGGRGHHHLLHPGAARGVSQTQSRMLLPERRSGLFAGESVELVNMGRASASGGAGRLARGCAGHLLLQPASRSMMACLGTDWRAGGASAGPRAEPEHAGPARAYHRPPLFEMWCMRRAPRRTRTWWRTCWACPRTRCSAGPSAWAAALAARRRAPCPSGLLA